MTTPAFLYEHMDLPGEARLDKRIYKKMFMERGQLSSTDKRALSEDIEQIVWVYTLKASTLRVRPYEDEEREYLEIAVIEVTLSSRKRAARLAEIIHRTIPYPVFLVLFDGTATVVSVAHKRFSLSERGTVVAQDFATTPWMEGTTELIDTDFVQSLAIRSLNQLDFYRLYQDLVQRVLARNCAELTGVFELKSVSEEERRKALAQYRELEREITSLKATIRKETEFARKVELNTQIKAREAQLQQAVTAL